MGVHRIWFWCEPAKLAELHLNYYLRETCILVWSMFRISQITRQKSPQYYGMALNFSGIVNR
jgi:hypothetical protein